MVDRDGVWRKQSRTETDDRMMNAGGKDSLIGVDQMLSGQTDDTVPHYGTVN